MSVARRLQKFIAVQQHRGLRPTTIKIRAKKSHRYSHIADLYSQKYREQQQLARSHDSKQSHYHAKLAKLYYRLASSYRALDQHGGTNEFDARKQITKVEQQIHALDPDINLVDGTE